MIKGVRHFSFTVSNIDETKRFFEEMLGLEMEPIREERGEYPGRILGMPGAQLRVSALKPPGGGRVEFIEYLEPRGQHIELKTCNPGVAHLCFEVDDIEKMCKELTAKGVVFTSSPIWVDAGQSKGHGVCYFKGPDGITLELSQAP